MSATTRGLRVSLALSVVAAMIGLSATPAPAADDREYVKYYQVAESYQNAPENLTEIAARFLGDGGRSAEVFNLNQDRKQPNGKKLTDPARLEAGWTLQLPWDAVGAEVRYGLLPGSAPATTPASPGTPATPKQPRPSSPAPATAGTPKPAKPSGCAAVAASSNRSDWAGLRLAADQAWPQSRGKDQLVAVVDSGVEAAAPQLTGHVGAGRDVATGTGRGDTDCLGTGTAMAGIIVAQPGKNQSGVAGVAPDAMVLPIRVVGGDARAKTSDAAEAIDAAVASGATVIAVGSYVDANAKVVKTAVAAAVKKNVVVVQGAAIGSKPGGRAVDGVLRVGGVGVDGRGAADYRSGGVDVVAPGVNVSSLGPKGPTTASGTQYAVAFVAGTAALVRAAYPELDAGQVAHRVQVSSDKMGDGAAPDATFGWGMINPAVAVTLVLPEEAEAAPSAGEQASSTVSETRSGGQVALLVVVTLGALAAAVFLIARIRRLLRA